jgi:cell division protein FtsL
LNHVNRSLPVEPARPARTKPLALLGRWLLLLIAMSLCLTVLIQTYRERRAARAAAQAAEAATQQLQIENQQLRDEIDALRNDPETIERIAREELNMLLPDELVLAITDERVETPKDESGAGTQPASRPAAMKRELR